MHTTIYTHSLLALDVHLPLLLKQDLWEVGESGQTHITDCGQGSGHHLQGELKVFISEVGELAVASTVRRVCVCHLGSVF